MKKLHQRTVEGVSDIAIFDESAELRLYLRHDTLHAHAA